MLGLIYENGEAGIEIDIDKALSYFKRAEKKSHAGAKYRIAYIKKNWISVSTNEIVENICN